MKAADHMKEENQEATPMWKIVALQFLEHKAAFISLMVILFFVFIALFSPFIGKMLHIDPYQQSIFNRFAPFNTVLEKDASDREEAVEIFIDRNHQTAASVLEVAKNNRILDPGVDDEDYLYELMEKIVTDQALFQKLAALGHPDVDSFLKLTQTFRMTHYLGTDELGRDMLMRLIYGARVSISIGLLVAFISAVIGLIVGSVAGYYGGVVDAALMRVTDSLLALPLIPVLILFAAADIKQIPIIGLLIGGENESIAKVVVVICIFSWMTVARLVRAGVLSVKEKEFIYAAKSLGSGDLRIILLHITPNILPPLLVAVTLNVGTAILFESALSFLGVGIQPPTPSWGNMLFNAQELIHHAPMLALLPGTLILVTVICFNFVGDGLQDAIDPKSIQR